MIIVGGTYSESVTMPSHGPAQGGSGMRGALALGARCEGLVTGLSAEDVIVDSAVASKTKVHDRPQPIEFQYLSPVSTPRIFGIPSKIESTMSVDHEGVLMVGMVEQVQRRVRAKRLVIDPQSPRGQSSVGLDDLEADEIVLSANAREAANMLDSRGNAAANAESLLAKHGYAAVVVRAGAQGCFVADANGVHEISAHPTQSVWSLGSGDTFSASFGSAWTSGADPVEAAVVASNATAWWCETRDPLVPEGILDGTRTVEDLLDRPGVPLVSPRYSPRIYLGGPFFTVAERWLVDLVLATLSGLGANVFSPVHHVGPGDDSVALKDIAGLEECDAMLALADHYDPGTIFEAGWAISRKLPVIAYRSQQLDEGDKMLVGLGAEIHSDLTTALYRVIWAAQGALVRPGRYGGDAEAKAP